MNFIIFTRIHETFLYIPFPVVSFLSGVEYGSVLLKYDDEVMKKRKVITVQMIWEFPKTENYCRSTTYTLITMNTQTTQRKYCYRCFANNNCFPFQ